MTMIENEQSNCMKMVSCRVMTIDNQKGYRWHKGHWGILGGVGSVGAIREHWGHQRCRVSRMYWGLAGSVGTQGPEGVYIA